MRHSLKTLRAVCLSRRGIKVGGRCSAWGALRMHQRNLALQKDVKRQKKDIDRLYTEYDSLCKDYNRVLEERNDLRVKHEWTISSITTPQEYKSVLDERNDLKVKHYYTKLALLELTNGHWLSSSAKPMSFSFAFLTIRGIL